MSTLSGTNVHAESDVEYWEFVHCAVCFLPFIPDPVNAPSAPPSVPFWLTECGHVVCNIHLNADQSCAPCGAQSIQLVPLQRDMMPPMSDWFRSVPHGLDALASAAKFQQNNMASLVRFYKHKCSQQRAAMNKIGNTAAQIQALQNQVEQLQRDNEQLRAGACQQENQRSTQRFPYAPNRNDGLNESLAFEPSHSRNVNGKRPLIDTRQHQRTSSPRLITTPLVPPRLTLPSDHQQPVFPSGVSTTSGSVGHQVDETRTRPGSSRFDQYAYQPAAMPYRAQPLRHQQQVQGHHRQQQMQEEDGQQTHRQQAHAETQQQQMQGQRQQQQRQHMLPPPMPSRAQGKGNVSQNQAHGRTPFRPAGQQSARHTQQIQPSPCSTAPHQSRPPHDQPQPHPFPTSVPSPSPHVSSSRLPSTAVHAGASTDRRFAVPPTPSNRFYPPRGTVVPGTNVGTPRSQAYQGVVVGTSTRVPFVPGMG